VPAGNGRVAARWSHAATAVVAVLLVAAATACSSSKAATPSGSTSSSSTIPSSSEPTTTSTVPSTPHVPGTRVDVYGDSLALQSQDALEAQGRAHGLKVTVNAFYGLAPCDISQFVMSDIDSSPDALVLSFSGNNLSPCMQRKGKPISGPAYFAVYRHDVGNFVAAASARGIAVFVVGSPAFPSIENIPDRIELNRVFREIAARYAGARYVPSAPFVSPRGFTRRLPCLPGETIALGCRGGTIEMRAGNGIHFDEPHPVPCPVRHDVCEYSAGGRRYADAILAGLAHVDGLAYLPASETVGVPIDKTRDGVGHG
jgi:hypothetical protein